MAKIVSKKTERVAKLIALDNMLRYQNRAKSGSATFSRGQLAAALQVLEEVLNLDHIVRP